MVRSLAVFLTVASASFALAQRGQPILNDEGNPVKVIVGTKVVTPDRPPRLPNPLPSGLTDTPPSSPEVLPIPRIAVVDDLAIPRRIGMVPYLLGETISFLEDRRDTIKNASHKTLGGEEPAKLHESMRETTPIVVTAPTPPAVHVTHTAAPAESPHFTTVVMQQTAAILAAVVILAVMTLAAYFFVLRKYVPFTSLFQVQVVGGGVASGVPFVPAALAEPANDPFADVTPNFELGPTYEEEMAMNQAAQERQEMAVLAHIAELNIAIQSELKEQGLLSDEAPERSALETLTQPEPAV